MTAGRWGEAGRLRMSLQEGARLPPVWAGCGVKCSDELSMIPGAWA